MATRARLQRGVGVALWRQIADGIRTGIAGGLADAKGRLPPEAQLAERFGVNRHTVRAAIAALAHEGVLQSEQGRGTYVRRQKRLVYPIGERTRFSAGLGDQARETRSDMMGSATETAPEQVAAALGLVAGDRVVPYSGGASTWWAAPHADDNDTTELQLAPGAIVIVTRALNCDLSGKPIQYSATRFAADRVELAVESTGPVRM